MEINSELAEKIRAKYNAKYAYTDAFELIANEEVEAVYIASPNALHYPQTKAALLAGKHVLCEKPFATTAAQAAEMIALAKEILLVIIKFISVVLFIVRILRTDIFYTQGLQ